MGALRFAFRALAALVCRCFVAPRSLSTLRREYGDGPAPFKIFLDAGLPAPNMRLENGVGP
jgi:hypothetical protein